jgi:hypothetical protein
MATVFAAIANTCGGVCGFVAFGTVAFCHTNIGKTKRTFFFFFLKSTNTLALGDLKVNTNFDDAAGRFSVAQVPLPSNAIDDADAINLAAAYSVIAADAELRTRLLQREREEKKGKKLTSFFFFFFFF